MTWRHAGQEEHLESGPLERAAARMEDELEQAVARREHYLLAIVGFVVTPPLEDMVLDHENIRVPPAIGCYVCEQPWTRNMPRRCPGEPPR